MYIVLSQSPTFHKAFAKPPRSLSCSNTVSSSSSAAHPRFIAMSAASSESRASSSHEVLDASDHTSKEEQQQPQPPRREPSVVFPAGTKVKPSESRREESNNGLQDGTNLARQKSEANSLHLERALSRGVDPKKWTERKKPWQNKVTSFEDVLNQDYEGEGTLEKPYLIDWLEADVENPQAFGTSYKWTISVFVSFATLAVALSSSAYAGAVPSLREEFPGHTQTEYTLGVSMFVLGFAIGPLLWAPLSEVLGRRILFLISYAFLALWSGVAIASPNFASVIVFRFLAGAFGSSPLTNAGGTLGDIFSAAERGLGMAIFASAPFLGPALGPITGGFLGESAGWRWVFGYLTIFVSVVFFVGIFFLPETYAPVLLRWRAKKMSKATGHVYEPRMDQGKDVRIKTLFQIALSRPWKLLFLEPIVLLLSIYMGLVYAILYSLFAAFPIVFQQQRGWSTGVGGLAFLGLLVGIVIALIFVIVIDNPRYVRVSKKHNGFAPPEQRLFGAMVGAPTLTIGLVWFAASDAPSTHWIVPIIGSVPFGFGLVLVFLSIQNYLVDSYLVYAASVLAGNSLLRSLLGMAFPLFTPYQYENLGVQWGAAIPAFLSLACIPMPFLFFKYGPAIRTRCKYAAEAAKIHKLMSMHANKHETEGKKEEA